MIESLLFPVDFSPSCAAMAAFVERAAAMFRASVTLLHVCDLVSHNGFELYSRPVPDIAEDHRRVARDRLDAFLPAEFPDTECFRLLLSGNAAARITQCARDGRFDLIVMPTHAGRFRRMLLGSTTASVLNDADCPVLTTQHAETITPRPLEHRVWACALSLNADSERVLRQASRAADAAGAKLSVIHVLDSRSPEPPAPSHLGEQTQYPQEREARRSLDELQKTVGSKAEILLTAGAVLERLLETVQESAADVLIIGRNGEPGTSGGMSRLSYELIRDSPCPVLSV